MSVFGSRSPATDVKWLDDYKRLRVFDEQLKKRREARRRDGVTARHPSILALRDTRGQDCTGSARGSPR